MLDVRKFRPRRQILYFFLLPVALSILTTAQDKDKDEKEKEAKKVEAGSR
jgi:cadmium resistance protein CadD (predicted permease)